MLACILFVFGALCEYAALLFQRGRTLENEDNNNQDEENDFDEENDGMRMVCMNKQQYYRCFGLTLFLNTSSKTHIEIIS